jgi:catechol 2,3-dioxygenase-like lactoylglutathione lyase family enzyme
MLDRVTIHVSDRETSERFYRVTLGALGIEPTRTGPEGTEWGDFAVARAGVGEPPTRNLHVGFVAPSRELVEEFWRAGTAAGYEDDGAPGERPEYTPSYYGAFLRDPDGNSAEAVNHSDVRPGGHVDHLWIGVRDLDPAVAFYATLVRFLGLRPGREWDDGRQFRGAWATLSLVADGRPPTEHLQLAFPARDRRTVEGFYDAATAAGYDPVSAPGSDRRRSVYAACVIDPTGTKVESVFCES